MNNPDDPLKIQLISHAIKVRKACVDFAIYLNSYYKANDLEGMCAVASGAYIEYIKLFGLQGNIIHTNFHAWVSVEKYFVDLTCSQYGLGNFFVIKRNELHKVTDKANWPYRNYIKGSNYTMSAWPSEQKPSKEIVRKILAFGGLA